MSYDSRALCLLFVTSSFPGTNRRCVIGLSSIGNLSFTLSVIRQLLNFLVFHFTLLLLLNYNVDDVSPSVQLRTSVAFSAFRTPCPVESSQLQHLVSWLSDWWFPSLFLCQTGETRQAQSYVGGVRRLFRLFGGPNLLSYHSAAGQVAAVCRSFAQHLPCLELRHHILRPFVRVGYAGLRARARVSRPCCPRLPDLLWVREALRLVCPGRYSDFPARWQRG